MRLLNVYTFELVEFFGDNIPPYKITSHRWVNDEANFKDFIKKRNQESRGYKKIEGFCKFVREDNERLKKHVTNDLSACEWIWIDTCCIDKRSTADVSESINSMASWYSRALECIAYLGDVTSVSTELDTVTYDFDGSEWFTRGWTLQELLLPRFVIFLNRDWKVIGHKCAYCTYENPCKDAGRLLNIAVAEVTKIPEDIVRDFSNSSEASIAEKMEWMANRTTTKTEDMAYCLLGIFDVNMPLLYGEGSKALVRLKREIQEQQRLAAAEPETTLEDVGSVEARIRLLEKSTEQRMDDVAQSTIRPVSLPDGGPAYSCPHMECASAGVSFRRKVDLIRHQMRRHGKQELELFDCEVSGCHRRGQYGFTRKDLMREHMHQAHRSMGGRPQPRDPPMPPIRK